MQENYKILVVDDDMRSRALLERYLTEQGFQVRSVANAEQMDRLLTRESFHLMVLDLMLPGEDGLSICRRLRSQSNPMPIIMVTAKGEEVDRIVGLEIGADDYIPKPFNPGFPFWERGPNFPGKFSREILGPFPKGKTRVLNPGVLKGALLGFKPQIFPGNFPRGKFWGPFSPKGETPGF